jgi:hypothetical protein
MCRSSVFGKRPKPSARAGLTGSTKNSWRSINSSSQRALRGCRGAGRVRAVRGGARSRRRGRRGHAGLLRQPVREDRQLLLLDHERRGPTLWLGLQSKSLQLEVRECHADRELRWWIRRLPLRIHVLTKAHNNEVSASPHRAVNRLRPSSSLARSRSAAGLPAGIAVTSSRRASLGRTQSVMAVTYRVAESRSRDRAGQGSAERALGAAGRYRGSGPLYRLGALRKRE